MRVKRMLACIMIVCLTGLLKGDPRYSEPSIEERSAKEASIDSRIQTLNLGTFSTEQLQSLGNAQYLLYPFANDGTWTQAMAPNDDGSFGPVALPFTFPLYGSNYTSVWINNNGNLSFTGAYSAFTSTGFPSTSYVMVAPFWADVDTRAQAAGTGLVWYKFIDSNSDGGDDTLVVTWDNVGYYSYGVDKLNTFQVAITDGSNPHIGLGNTVCFSYDVMEWTTGSASGGSGGFWGTPATVGCNRGNGIDYVQIGRFDRPGTDYDGPYGNNDGVHWLNGQILCMNTGGVSQNIPPIVQGFPQDNVIYLDPADGEMVDLLIQFLSPEIGQTTTVTIDDPHNAQGNGLVVQVVPGNVASVHLGWIPDCQSVGIYDLFITATDSFDPPAATTVSLTIIVGEDCNGNGRADTCDIRDGISLDTDGNGIPDECEGNLIVTAVTTDGDAFAGRSLHVAYDVMNADPTNTVSYSYKDVIYLSADDVWDIDDIALATIQRNDHVAPSQGYHVERFVTLPGVLPGDYYILVRTDHKHAPEGHTGAAPISIDIHELSLDSASAGEFTAQERARYYKVNTIAGEDLVITLDDLDDTGSNKLYVAYNRVPTRSQFDYLHAFSFAPDQKVVVPNTAEGTYYILAYAEQIPPAVPSSFEITAKYVPLQVTAISPTSGGNTGQVTINLKGARFTEDTQVTLIGPNGQQLNAVATYFTDSTTIDATIDLTGTVPGHYSLAVNNSSESVVVADAFLIEQGGGPVLQPFLTIPSVSRIGRIGVMYAEVKNVGTIDSFVPVSCLRLPDGIRATLDLGSYPTETDRLLIDFTPTNSQLLKLSPNTGVRIPIHYVVSTLGPKTVSLDVYNCPLNTGDLYSNRQAIWGPDYATHSDPVFSPFTQPLVDWQVTAQYNSPPIECTFHLAPRGPSYISSPSTTFMSAISSNYSTSDWIFTQSSIPTPSFSFWIWRNSDQAGASLYNPGLYPWIQVVTVDTLASTPYVDGEPDGKPFYWPDFAVGPSCAEAFDDEPYNGNFVAMAKMAILLGTTPYVMDVELELHPSEWDHTGTMVPIPVTIGSAGICYGFTLTVTADDPSNTDPGPTTPTGSWDPNLKIRPSGYGPAGFINGHSNLPYTIFFENLETAGAAAVEVSVKDQLSESLDWTSFELTQITFGELVIDIPAGLNYYNDLVDFDGWTWNAADGWHTGQTPLVVNVEAGIDLDTGILLLNLNCADPATGNFPVDPYAGFLPPDQDHIAYPHPNNPGITVYPGEGSISYVVRPRPGLQTGTEIRNAATIIFDTNPPIDTPETVNTVDSGAPTSRIAALPPETKDPLLDLSWSGEDDLAGSGVDRFDIYASIDGGPFALWKTTAETSATYNAQVGHTYAFYSIARDHVGNRELPPQQADTVVKVLSPNEPPVITCSAPKVLWSPSQELVDVSSVITVEDPDGDEVVLTIRAFSNEPELPETADGTGRNAPDFKDERLSGRGLLVRAERQARGDGRFYILLVHADDGIGGVSVKPCLAAVVPHAANEASLVAVMAKARTALAQLHELIEVGGALPPAGMYEHGLSDPLGPKQ